MTGSPKTSLRAVIVDDETLARQYLKELLKPYQEIEIVALCKNGFDAVTTIGELSPDVVFLDIQMPGLDGFEVLEALGDQTPEVIFVTAYDEYALRAFEVHAVDYLLKPFSEERLKDALERVLKGKTGQRVDGDELAKAARGNDFLNRIVIKEGQSITLVSVNDVDYIAAADDYVAIHGKGASWLKLQTISSMAASLDPEKFVRIHRSTILNIDRLVRVVSATKDAKVAVLKDGAELPVSRNGYQNLKKIVEGV